MPALIITVDLQCCRCRTKIQKLLCCMQGEFEIEKIIYEKDTVVVSGPFDAEKLSCKLWCKAGNKIIKDIKIKPPTPKPEPKTKPKPKPEQIKLIPFPYSYMYPPQYCPTWPCGCATPHCECHSKPPAPAPAKPACGCTAWSSSCHSCSPYQPYLPPAMPYPSVPLCEEENPNYGGCAVM